MLNYFQCFDNKSQQMKKLQNSLCMDVVKLNCFLKKQIAFALGKFDNSSNRTQSAPKYSNCCVGTKQDFFVLTRNPSSFVNFNTVRGRSS